MMDKGDECLAAVRLRTVDGEVSVMGRSLANGFARLCNVMIAEMVEACTFDGLYQCFVIFEVECVVEVAKHSIVVSSCQTALVALWVI